MPTTAISMECGAYMTMQWPGKEEMKFSGIRMMSIDMLGLSQIYLNADKIASV